MKTLEILAKRVVLFGAAFIVVTYIAVIIVTAVAEYDRLSAAQRQEDMEVQLMASTMGVSRSTARRILRNDPDPFDILKGLASGVK